MHIVNDWTELLKKEQEKEYYKTLIEFINKEYQTKSILPKKEEIFNALRYTSYKDCSVVIIGQNPYQTKGFPCGLSFSTQPGVQIPKSLQNIYKELKSDLGCYIPDNGDLTKWAKQGVLLLNSSLTVIEGDSESHMNIGWENFTDEIISILNKKEQSVVFILWGNNARKKKFLITNKKHLIIESAHPSPLSASRGFFESKPFSKTNNFLIKNNIKPIDWQIENIKK